MSKTLHSFTIQHTSTMSICHHRAGQRCFKLLALIGSPQLSFSKVFPAEQTSWPNWQTLLACTEADALVGNKRFFHLWYFRNK